MPAKSYNIVSTKFKYIYTWVWQLAKQFLNCYQKQGIKILHIYYIACKFCFQFQHCSNTCIYLLLSESLVNGVEQMQEGLLSEMYEWLMYCDTGLEKLGFLVHESPYF